MSLSVNNNPGALIALQNLTSTETQLQKTQNEVSTGLAVAAPSDNGAIWAIAQNQRATAQSLDSVTQSLQRAQSTIDVATSAGQSVSDLLTQLKSKALAASDTSLDTASRAALNADFTSLRNQITTVVDNASFNGANLIDSGAKNIYALANSAGTSSLTVAAQDLSLGGSNVSLTATTSISTATLAQNAIATIETSITSVNNALAKLGTAENALTSQQTFVSNLQDTIDTGVGNLVNANLAKESAQLQALQTKQQLGIQALSIANSSSSSLLSLFR
jgi:flagellin